MNNRKPIKKRASLYDAHFYNILDYFILAILVAGVLIFILYPLLCMVKQSFAGTEGFSTEVALDFDVNAVNTFQKNFPNAKCICGDICDENIKNMIIKLCKERKVNMIIGGPPCQAYSVAGRARLGKKIEEDPRNDLYKFYVEFLKRYKPKMFVFENVLGIFTAKGGEPFRDLIRLVRELDYNIDFREQIASQHGVLQKRHRVIIVGWQNKRDTQEDTSYHYPYLLEEQMPYKMMRDLFCDLPIVKAGEGTLCGIVHYTKPLSDMEYLKKSGIRGVLSFTTQHIARPNNPTDREIYKQAVEQWNEGKRLRYDKLDPSLQKHKNTQTFLNRFCVVDPNGVCHTVVAHIAMDGHYYIYPTPNPTTDNVRSITIREAARIQSFPDDYFFEGSRSSAFKQIGNAVPVVFAEKIALEIKKILAHEDELRRTQNR